MMHIVKAGVWCSIWAFLSFLVLFKRSLLLVSADTA
jgi:hypothetical protein